MPELPEVETVRSGLQQYLIDAQVTGVEIHDERSLKRHLAGPSDFVQTLLGARIEGVVRRGKFLWMPLELRSSSSTKLALVGHLGMSGQMLVRDFGAEADKLNRITIHLDGASGEQIEFRFVDQRLFGSLQLDEMVSTPDGNAGGFAGSNGSQQWSSLIARSAAHIARDPLDENFDRAAVIARMRKKNSGIKRVLLDQGVLSGIGNIYADEALWAAKLHYDQSASSLSVKKLDDLLDAVTRILRAAVAVGGTSFDEQYKNVNGESGYFEVSLNAYGQTGKPCARCGTPIRRDSWMNRGSHFCPKCQKQSR
ncbi:MAG: bifunctional DNA-formamidopyrimidine glycosylase/DNA-(apurinic or apyrimidinic site) lyase [Microbacteriaceae bacterium]